MRSTADGGWNDTAASTVVFSLITASDSLVSCSDATVDPIYSYRYRNWRIAVEISSQSQQHVYI